MVWLMLCILNLSLNRKTQKQHICIFDIYVFNFYCSGDNPRAENLRSVVRVIGSIACEMDSMDRREISDTMPDSVFDE